MEYPVETEIDPSQLDPFQSAKRVTAHVSDFVAKHPGPRAYFDGMRALDIWQMRTVEDCIPKFNTLAAPGSQLHTLLLLSHRAGMKIVKRLRGQLCFFLVGGKWTFKPDWDESWN